MIEDSHIVIPPKESKQGLPSVKLLDGPPESITITELSHWPDVLAKAQHMSFDHLQVMKVSHIKHMSKHQHEFLKVEIHNMETR